VPDAPNSDVLVFKTGGAVVEFEERHTIFEQPGKLRLGVFANRGNTGNYRNALAITAANPTLDINQVIVGIHRDNPKHGFYVNAEQQVRKDVGVFARASWNDGQNQILSFTDIDRSVFPAPTCRLLVADLKSQSPASRTSCACAIDCVRHAATDLTCNLTELSH
jgi:high affinity Mn2+ porin